MEESKEEKFFGKETEIRKFSNNFGQVLILKFCRGLFYLKFMIKMVAFTNVVSACFANERQKEMATREHKREYIIPVC